MALQQAFIKEGLLKGDVFSGPFQDEFDEIIAETAVNFQAKYGIRQTGFVGPITRAKLNALYGCGTQPIPATYQPLPADPNIRGFIDLVSANENITRKVFGQSDWKWKVSIANDGTNPKIIKRMILVHNTSGEGWATDESVANPVGKALYQLITTLPNNCQANCDLYYTPNLGAVATAGNTLNFAAYGDPGSWQFTGGYLLIEFADNTSAKIHIPASTITPTNTDISPVTVSEQVKCVFNGATTEQNCWSRISGQSEGIGFNCSGVGTCVANVSGFVGTRLAWTGSCGGGFAYTTIDGQNEYANFSCGGNTQPSITVTSPNGGETYPPGSTQQFTWWSSGISKVNPVTLRLRGVDDGREYQLKSAEGAEVFLTDTPNDGSQLVLLGQDYPNQGYRFEVKTAYNGQTFLDSSDSYFKITSGVTQPSITVTSPNGGEIWKKGTEQKISWSIIPKIVGGLEAISQLYPLDISLEPYYPPCSGQFCPQYALESPYTIVKGIYANSNDIYVWKVGDIKDVNRSISDGSYKIKICRSDVANVCDTSDAYFTVVAPTNPYDACRLDKLDGSNITRNSYTDRNVCLAQLCDVYGPANLSTTESKCMFQGVEIKRYTRTPSITVTSPNGGEELVVNSSRRIQWNFSGNIQRVNIILENPPCQSCPPLLPYIPPISYVIQNIENNGSFDWDVGLTNLGRVTSGTHLIKICDATNPAICDKSDSSFKILPLTQSVLKVISPSGGENLIKGNRIEIKWQPESGVDQVYLYVDQINSSNRYPIGRNITNTGFYSWKTGNYIIDTYHTTVPVFPDGSYYLTICNSNVSDAKCDSSDAYFTVTAPAAASSLNSVEMASILESMKVLLLQLGGSL